MFQRLIALMVLCLLSLAGHAQTALSPAQLATVCTSCKADTGCNVPRQAGDSITVLSWLNAARTPATLAWRVDLQPIEIDEAATYTTYDSLTQGKRDEWERLLAFPRSFAKNKNRNVVTDVWGSATAGSIAEAILLAGTYNATNVQNALGGTTRTTGTVSALALTFTGAAGAGDATWLVQPANCQ